MQHENNREGDLTSAQELIHDDLTSNQEHIIAFLVLALFGLMYWFFMHGDGSGIESKTEVTLTKDAPLNSNTSRSVATEELPINNAKRDEAQARRDALNALKQDQSKEVQMKLSPDVSNSEQELALATKTDQIESQEAQQSAAERLKAQALIEAKRLKNEQSKEKELLVKLSNEQSELEAKIKAVQEAIAQQEQAISNSVGIRKPMQVDTDDFESRLKALIVNKDSEQAIVLDEVTFLSGSASFNQDAIRQIVGLATILQEYEDSKVLLRGHTDNRGDETKNVALSLSRSMNIKKRLVSLGISSSRINVEGLGSQMPIADNATQSGRRENRRIDLLVIDE